MKSVNKVQVLVNVFQQLMTIMFVTITCKLVLYLFFQFRDKSKDNFKLKCNKIQLHEVTFWR